MSQSPLHEHPDRCPTCGGRVTVDGDTAEGTLYFRPVVALARLRPDRDGWWAWSIKRPDGTSIASAAAGRAAAERAIREHARGYVVEVEAP